MADGGGLTFADLVIYGRILAHRHTSSRPGDETTRYLLRTEFPFKTAKAMFGMAAAEGAGDSAEMVVAPPDRKLPLENEDILTEILRRLPPQPAPLACAWLVSRRWARLGASAPFRRRLQAHHRKPPVLGVYKTDRMNLVFVPTLDAPNAIPPERFSLKVVADHDTDWWTVLGCRHGRVLVINHSRAELIVFHPVSGDRHLVFIPPDFLNEVCSTNGAVVVEERHHDQSPSPFKLVLVGDSDNCRVAGAVSARVYSSETRAWGDLVSTPGPADHDAGRLGPCTMVGNGLYWWLAKPQLGSILHFDLDSQTFAVIAMPPVAAGINIGCSRIIRSEDGDGLGLAVLSYPTLQIYDRKVDPAHGSTSWPLQKTLAMDHILNLQDHPPPAHAYIMGYTEEADAIVVSVYNDDHNFDLYILQLDSMECKKLDGRLFIDNDYYRPFGGFYTDDAYYPFASFYTGPSVLQLTARVGIDGSLMGLRRSQG